MQSNEQRMHLSRLRVSANNPRGKLQRKDWIALVPSIKRHGVITPILIRPIDGGTVFEVVAGERRYHAANDAFDGDYDMPVLMRELSNEEAFTLASIENLQREPMNPIREAEACQQILLTCNGDKREAAAQMGWEIRDLDRHMALLACTEKVRCALIEGRVRLGHAELLATVPPATQDSTLDKVIAGNVPVHELKAQLGKFARRLSDAPFDQTECASCPHNSNIQSQLFSEALGDGYCTHPTHYEDLILKYVDGIAEAYKDSYPVVRIVKPNDGFVPLPVREEGELGVGVEQFEACKGCGSFGCSVSAMPGSYGAVEESLCFDAGCNSKKIAARRKAVREATSPAPTAPKEKEAAAKTTAGPVGAKPASTSNGIPSRVKEYRVREWRKWAANQLMLQHDRNKRALVAVLLSHNHSRLSADDFRGAVEKLTGQKVGANLFEGALKDAESIGDTQLPTVIECVAASAAFGIGEFEVDVLLNYLEVDEAKHFKLTAEFLDLFTKSELESLAAELKLKKAIGDGFARLRDGKKDAFVEALLSVPGFQYAGLVPKVMRYKRKAFPHAKRTGGAASDGATTTEIGAPVSVEA